MDWRQFPPVEHDHVVFAPPPQTFTDVTGRQIDLRVYGDGPIETEEEALVEMYLDFDVEHRSLGLPPIGEARIRKWLAVLFEGLNVLAWDGERVVGQASLVESGDREYELAIFVHQAYHGTGIGTHLTEALLRHGQQEGARRVWLLVERDNTLAVNLYNDVGFAVCSAHGYDVEMEIFL